MNAQKMKTNRVIASLIVSAAQCADRATHARASFVADHAALPHALSPEDAGRIFSMRSPHPSKDYVEQRLFGSK
jgi:hypothetical protein